MNIFRVLASGDGSINEPNISALLGYLLDPSEDHGISNHLLNSILKDFNKDLPSKVAGDKWECFVYLETRMDFDDDDKKCKKGKKNRRDLDVLVTFRQKDKEKDKDKGAPDYILGIENKINDGALQSDQLKDEWDLLKQHYPDSTIYFCFLTPPTTRSNNEFEEFVQSDPAIEKYVKHLYWKRPEDEKSSGFTEQMPSPSISERLAEILEKEQYGKIDPIPSDSTYLIKSLLSFIRTDFETDTKQVVNERRKYKKSWFEYLETLLQKYDFNTDIKRRELKGAYLKTVQDDNTEEFDSDNTENNLVVGTVNDLSRCSHVKVGNHERYDVLYYPNENDKMVLRRFDKDNPPPGVKIYCKQDGQIGFIDGDGIFQPLTSDESNPARG